jgi:Tol biopolymer transport system component/C-terminal processing protease CtpA/Prc
MNRSESRPLSRKTFAAFLFFIVFAVGAGTSNRAVTSVSAGTSIAAQTTPLWLRYPAISPDGKTIVFTYKGDLYRVPSAGGSAVPLTIHEAHDFMPVWSPDGKSIAFASDRFGNFDVYLIPAEGGEARRLTVHSAAEYPYAFTPDNASVLFGAARLDAASNRTFPTGSQPELYKVPAKGGRVEQVLSTPAEDAKPSRNGRYLIYHDKKGGENIWRKHHTSAIARDIWIFDAQDGTHKKLTSFAGEDRSPVLADDDKSFYYLSEESGSFNVHKMGLTGGSARQITSFKTHPVRFLSASAEGTLCFGFDGEIYTQKGSGRPDRVKVVIASDSRTNNERVIPVSGGAREFAVSPNAKEIAFVVRGEVFVTSVDGGVTKRITKTPEQEAGVSFSPDGKALLYASERNGRWRIYETRRTREQEPYFYASTVLKETPVIDNGNENTQPKYSPDGKEVSFIENRMTLRILNLASKQTRTLLTDKELFSMGDNDQYYEWSPDGHSLLFNYSIPGFSPTEVGFVRADGQGRVVNLTQSGFDDRRPKWIMGGKAMLWFSNRDGLKAVAQSGGAQSDAYALFFTREAWDRFRLSKEEAALLKEMEEKKEKDKADAAKEKKETAEKKDAPEPVAIEWDGLSLRKARLTIHSSSMGDALVSKDGETLYYLARFERGMNLWSTNLRTRETKMLVSLNANGGSLNWDKDQKSIFLLADGGLSKIDPAAGKRESIGIGGEMVLDVEAERGFMFDHVWRRTSETFYTAGFHGADWLGLKPVYEKFLPHLGDSTEFAEMLSEMLGELNVSHCGASFSSQNPNADATASLGVFFDLAYRGDGIKIDEVIKNGPLDKAGMNVAAGAIIESIDGEIISADKDPAQFLNRKAGKNTLLVVSEGGAKREIAVKPITIQEESSLLYDRWVRKNQEEVDRASGGRLGYIHVPGMNDRAYRTAYEEVMGKFADRAGIVVDTRFNGGGDLVADLAMFLSGRKFFDYTTDTRSDGYEPNFRWTKPSISIANEANYSDGHCYAFAYQHLKLGKLVGMPVPGTCTFAGWEMLQDGSVRWGVPPLGVKAVGIGYLENRQTEPDIKVMNEYAVVVKGRDQQLEAAVSALMKEIE